MADDIGAELARGFVTLSVKYADGDKGIQQGLKEAEDQSKESGKKIGENLQGGIVAGMQKGAQQGSAIISKSAATSVRDSDLKAVGGRIASGINDGMRNPLQRFTQQAYNDALGTLDGSAAARRGAIVGELLGRAISTPLRAISTPIQAIGTAFGNLRGPTEAHSAEVDALVGKYQALQERAKASTDVLANMQKENAAALTRNELLGGVAATLPFDAEEIAKRRQAIAQYKVDAVGMLRDIEAAKSRSSGSLVDPAKVRDASSAVSELGGHIKDATENVASLAPEAGEAAEGMEGIGAAILGLATDPITLVAGAVIGLVAGIGLTTDKLYELGKGWDETWSAMIVKTGASGQQLEQYKDIVKGIAADVPLSTDKIGSIVGSVAQQFNDQDDLEGLKEVSAQVGKLQGLVGEFDIRSLGKDFRQFGTDAKDQAADLDLMFTATQKTGITIDELSQSISTLGPISQQFKLNFADTAGIIASFEKAGLDPSRAFTSLSTAQQKLEKQNGVGSDLHKGLVDTLTQIQNLQKAGDEAGAKGLAETIFGKPTTRGGPDPILQALKGGLNPQDFSSALQGGAGIEKTEQQVQTFSEVWQKFKNQLSVGLEGPAHGLFLGIDQDLQKLAGFLTANQDKILGFFKFVLDAALDMGAGITTGIELSLKAVGSLTSAFGHVLGAAGDVASFFGATDVADTLKGWDTSMQGFNTSMHNAGDTVGGFSVGMLDFRNGLDGSAQSAINAAKVTETLGDKIKDVKVEGNDVTMDIKDNVPEVTDKLSALGISAKEIDGKLVMTADTDKGKQIIEDFRKAQTADPLTLNVDANTQQAEADMKGFMDRYRNLLAGINLDPSYGPQTSGQQLTPAGVADTPQNRVLAPTGVLPPAPPPAAGPQNPLDKLLLGGHEYGGAITGMGRPGDSKPIMAKVGEHMWTDDEVNKVGGQAAMYHLRSLARNGLLKGFAGGGAIEDGPDVALARSLVGTPYSKGARNDCSGMVGRIVNGALGVGGGLPTTQTMEGWLAARGFKSGIGPPGTISVGWYNHGSGENDGHAAMTLSDGENAESGGSHGNFLIGAGAAGAGSPEFDRHMYLPNMFGEGQAGSGTLRGLSGSGSGGAPSTEQLQSANDAVTHASGVVQVATQKLQEATDAPLGKGKDAQAAHDKAVTEAQNKLDAANRDLDSATKNRDLLGSGASQDVITAQKGITDALNQQADAQAKLDAVRADPKAKPSDITAATNSLTEANGKLTEAQQKLTEAQNKPADGKGGDKTNNLLSSLGGAGSDFLKGNLPPGFSDPTTWPALKSASGLMKYLGKFVKDPTAKALLSAGGSALGGDGSGVATAFSSLIPQPFGATQIGSPGDAPGQDVNPPPPGSSGGAGLPDPSAFIPNMPHLDGKDASPGPGNGGDQHIDMSTTIHGDVGTTTAAQKLMDHKESHDARNVRHLPRVIQQAS